VLLLLQKLVPSPEVFRATAGFDGGERD